MTTPENDYQVTGQTSPIEAWNASMQSIADRFALLEAWKAGNDNLEADQEAIVAAIIASLQADLDAIYASLSSTQDIIDQILNGEAEDSKRLGGQLPAFYRNASNLNAGAVPIGRLPGVALPDAPAGNYTVDLNTLKTAGWQPNLYNQSNPNAPGSGYYHLLNVTYNGGTTLTQLAFPYGAASSLTEGIRYRGFYQGAWTAWKQILAKTENDALYARIAAANVFTGLNEFRAADLQVGNDPSLAAPASIHIGKGRTSSNQARIDMYCNGASPNAITGRLFQTGGAAGYVSITNYGSGDIKFNTSGGLVKINDNLVRDASNTPDGSDALAIAGTDTEQRPWPATALKAAVEEHAPDNGIGIGQTWVNVTGSRSVGVSYQNLTGKPIMVSVYYGNTSGNALQVSANNSTWVDLDGVTDYGGISAIIPPNHYYRIPTYFTTWRELR